MSIKLDKNTGINLKKGSSISLKKEGLLLQHVCIGLNWGAIKKSKLFGLINYNKAVDLDGCVAVFDESGKQLDRVSFTNLQSKDGAIVHSGDDLTGDSDGDDGIDNEVIEIELNRINPFATDLFFFLNSFNGQDFSQIPYSKIRIYEGDKDQVNDVLATFNLSENPEFGGFVSMVMGRLSREQSGWQFTTIGEPLQAKCLVDCVEEIKNRFL